MKNGFTLHHFLKKNGEGFTLTEILVVISIITILTGIFVVNFPKAREQYTLQRAAHQLIQDLREIQQKALSPEERICPGEKKVYEFGAYFDQTSSDSYILFANCDEESREYNPDIDKTLKTINFERKVRICSLNPTSTVSIVFVPPSPKVYINGTTDIDNAQIILWWEKENLNCLESPKVKRKVIEVNKAGLIEIK